MMVKNVNEASAPSDASQSSQPSQPTRSTNGQRVQMSRSELELYVREGRPTGLLLSSVAKLKGMSSASIAKSCGIPNVLVKSIFNDHGVASIKNGAIKRIATALGIDLGTMRFSAGQVHTFSTANVSSLVTSSRMRIVMRAVGLLARGARVAEVSFGNGFSKLISGKGFYVAQCEGFRAVFTTTRMAGFNIDMIPSAQWVCLKKVDSRVRVENIELIENMKTNNITEGEFDEIFIGAAAFTWDDVRVASRINGVSKANLMEFIRVKAAELDESENNEAKRICNEDRPVFLRLVETELKTATA